VSKASRPFVVDANVLIDYANTDASILTLIARHLAPVHVPTPVLEKVDQVDAAECDHLGLIAYEPSIDVLLEAGAERGRLAFDDRICLIVARDNNWVCITNDRALRAACADRGVHTVWGLAVMLDLVAGGVLAGADARVVARAVHETNPRFVTASVLVAFEKKLEALAVEDPRERR
jgi:rRNA-processing protein FCF1